MSTFWRIALAWMLALALPLQGQAAQRLLGSAGVPVLAGAAGGQGHGAASESGLLEGQMSSLMSGPPSAHASHCDPSAAMAEGDPAKPASTGSCSACASCCHAVALPPAVPQLPLMPLALPEAPEVHLALAFVWLDGLERPPRPTLR